MYNAPRRQALPGVRFDEPSEVLSGLNHAFPTIGVSDDVTLETHCEEVPPGSRLYVYSDGVSEIQKQNGTLLNLDGLVELLSRSTGQDGSRVDRVRREAQLLQGSPDFKDDFCSSRWSSIEAFELSGPPRRLVGLPLIGPGAGTTQYAFMGWLATETPPADPRGPQRFPPIPGAIPEFADFLEFPKIELVVRGLCGSTV